MSNKYYIKNLLDKAFIVPSYQRGFRWTKYNVLKLLEDIFESYNDNSDREYNLQVLVLLNKNNENIVVDGQQRITTIFLIISYINFKKSNAITANNNFSINYENRDKSKCFLDSLAEIYTSSNNSDWNQVWKVFKDKNKDISTPNIDFRYMFEAYDLIHNEFDKIFLNKNILEIESYLLNKCFFYIQENSYSGTMVDGKTIFNKLNLGKIYLTNSELIKSEYMNPVYYDEKFESMVLLISKQWNDIEKDLQNPDFWAFIPHKYQYGIEKKYKNNRQIVYFEERNVFLARIDEIFQIYVLYEIYGCNKEDYERDYKNHNDSNYFLYEKIKEKIEENKKNNKNFNIQLEWGKVERIFSDIRELYQSDGRKTPYTELINKEYRDNGIDTNIIYNNSIYNLIAYVIYMYSDVQKKSELDICKIIADILNTDRDKRENYLKDIIKEGFCNIYDFSGNFDEKEEIRKTIVKLEYSPNNGANNEKIKNLLVLFNIILLQRNSAISNRYDFLNLKKWTIEHIYSQSEEKLIPNDGIIEKNKKDTKKLRKKIKNFEKQIQGLSEKRKLEINEEYIDKIKMVKDNKKRAKYELDKYLLEDKEIERIPIRRKQIIDSLCDYLSKSGKENTDWEDDVNNIRILIQVLEELNNKEKTSECNDLEKAKDFLDEHKGKICGEFIKEIRKKTNYPNVYIEKNLKELLKNKLQKNELEYIISLYDISNLLKNIGSNVGNREYLINTIFYHIENEVKELYEKYYLSNIENRKKLYEEEVEEYFKNKHNSYLEDDTITNIALLNCNENGDIGNSYLEKKEKIQDMISSGSSIPYSTLLVFTDRYQDMRKVDNGERWQWLLSSRKRYLDDIVNVLCEFLN
jgi:conserved hypothetical protein